MLYVFYGEDDFSLKESLSKFKQDADIQVLEAGKLSFETLVNTCHTLPFLASRRLVIVEGLLTRFELKGGKSLENSEWQGLAEYVSQLPPTTTLALVDGKLSPANPLLRELSSKAEVREFAPLKGVRLERWIQRRMDKLGGEISPRAIRLLAELIDGNLWILSQELEKLSLYAPGRRIGEEEVRELVSYAREPGIFALADAIVGRNLKRASRLLQEFFAEGAAPPYLLYMITRQFRLVIQARELISRGLSAEETSRSLGLTSDYLLQKVTEQAGKYSMERLEEAYRRLLDADVALKTGRLSGELALELLVTEICSRT